MAISKKWAGEGLQAMRSCSCTEPSSSSCRNQGEQNWPSPNLSGYLGVEGTASFHTLGKNGMAFTHSCPGPLFPLRVGAVCKEIQSGLALRVCLGR